MSTKQYTQLRLWASLLLSTTLGLGISAQTYVNKEWAATGGIPSNIDWTATALDPQGNLFVVGNTLASPWRP